MNLLIAPFVVLCVHSCWAYTYEHSKPSYYIDDYRENDQENGLQLDSKDLTIPYQVPYTYNNWEPIDSNGYQNSQVQQPTPQIYPVYQPTGYQNSKKNSASGYQNSQEHYALGSQKKQEYYNAESPIEKYYSFEDQDTYDHEYVQEETNQDTATDKVDEESIGSSLFHMIGTLVKMAISKKSRHRNRQFFESSTFNHNQEENGHPNIVLKSGIELSVLETMQELLLQMLNWIAFVATDITMQIIWPVASG